MTALPTCPHCFAPVRGDGRPSCLCAAVEAEDFDPLRIRPYVSLPDADAEDGDDARGGEDRGGGHHAGGGDAVGGGNGGGDEGGYPTGSGDGDRDWYRNWGRHRAGAGGGGGGAHTGRADRLEELPGVDAAVHRAEPAPYGADAYGVEAYGADAYEADAYGAELHAADVSEPLVRRAQRPGGPSSKTHRSAPGEPAVRDAAPFPTVDAAPAPARRRRTLPVVLAAAGAAVAATAVILSTDVLSGRGHDRAAPPDGGVAPPPATSPSGDDPAPTPSGTPAPSGTAGSPAPSPTALGTPETTVRRYRTTRPPHPPAPTRAAGTVTESPSGGSPSAPPTGPIVLREGSNGPEVAELQERLRQLTLYGDTADGRYDTAVRAAVSRYQRAYGVLGDPDGVYGTATRTSLESRTQEP